MRPTGLRRDRSLGRLPCVGPPPGPAHRSLVERRSSVAGAFLSRCRMHRLRGRGYSPRTGPVTVLDHPAPPTGAAGRPVVRRCGSPRPAGATYPIEHVDDARPDRRDRARRAQGAAARPSRWRPAAADGHRAGAGDGLRPAADRGSRGARALVPPGCRPQEPGALSRWLRAHGGRHADPRRHRAGRRRVRRGPRRRRRRLRRGALRAGAVDAGWPGPGRR